MTYTELAEILPLINTILVVVAVVIATPVAIKVWRYNRKMELQALRDQAEKRERDRLDLQHKRYQVEIDKEMVKYYRKLRNQS